jgi:RimJ/RimL family protein N-acetyltransferase
MSSRVQLVPLTPAWADAVEHWFRHPQVARWLGHAGWIHQALAMLTAPVDGETFRGSRVLRAHGWVGVDRDGAAVAYIGGDVYDRWVRPDGADDLTSMGLAFVVDPGRWRQGWGLALLDAVLAHPDVADVVVFFAGIEVGNTASAGLAARAGYSRVNEQPDDEDVVYWRRRR